MDTYNSIRFERTSGFWMEQMQDYVKNEKSIKYLEDDLCVLELEEDKRIRIFGSPWTAGYGTPGKAFQIPSDILVPHMPPFGIRDLSYGKVHSGCKDLSKTVLQ